MKKIVVLKLTKRKSAKYDEIVPFGSRKIIWKTVFPKLVIGFLILWYDMIVVNSVHAGHS